MRYIKIILVWIAISIPFGFLFKNILETNQNGVFAVFMSIGLLIGSIKAFLTYFASISKSSIFTDAKEIFNGKINLNGETELIIKGRKIILDYKLENNGRGVAEFIIAKVDLTNIDSGIKTTLKQKFDIIELNGRTYAVVYCSWGYKGEKFKDRIEMKLQQIDDFIKEKTFANTS
jgi:hypothetical protein